MGTKYVLVLLVGAVIMPAEDRDWEKLKNLNPGDRVGVLLRDRKYIQGQFRSWTPQRIEITRRQQQESLNITDVRSVAVRRQGSRWKSAGIGALIGFGVAFPFGAASAGYIADQNNPSLQTRIGMGTGFGLFGAGIGAAIGALTGGTRNVTVYREARKP